MCCTSIFKAAKPGIHADDSLMITDLNLIKNWMPQDTRPGTPHFQTGSFTVVAK